MDSEDHGSDDIVLAELGDRLSALRLSKDLTQAQLAHEAGVSKRTVERLEAGESAQMTSFIRILRSLGLLNRLETVLPPPEPRPMDLLRRDGSAPKRASGQRAPGDEPWSWADDA